MNRNSPTDDNPAGASPDNYRAALAQIRGMYVSEGPTLTGNETMPQARRILQQRRPAGGRRLSGGETIEVLVKALRLGVYMGPIQRLKPKGVGRGPECKDTQYDRSIARAVGVLGSIARPHRSRLTVKGATVVAAANAKAQKSQIAAYLSRISQRVSEAKLVLAILDEYAREGVKQPSARTVRRAIDAIRGGK